MLQHGKAVENGISQATGSQEAAMDLRCVSKLFIRYHLLTLVLSESQTGVITRRSDVVLKPVELAAGACMDGVCSLNGWKPGDSSGVAN